MRQCVFVIGTRAQLVKVAPVLRLACELGLEHDVWFTGQHNESIDDLIGDFDIKSKFVRPSAQKERSSILRLLAWLPGTLLGCYRYVKAVRTSTQTQPLVIVHGDTLSTFLGALAGRIAGGQIVHLESGLSSGRITDPFPEELLRRLTFRLTDFALCPNDDAYARMRNYDCKVVHTGENTLLDCVRYAALPQINSDEPATNGYFVASVHRFQNIYSRDRLSAIVGELTAVAAIAPVYFILHPPTRSRLLKYDLLGKLESAEGIKLQPRMPYTDFLALISGARGVFSDGGSNQEELSYLGVPAVLFRQRSERPDGIGANVVLYDTQMQPLSDYVRSGKLDALRIASRLDDSVQPSRITVDSLLEWAG
jgi:UDP-N-acetylglucosamine 2-epimerase (non-hydrolysing)